MQTSESKSNLLMSLETPAADPGSITQPGEEVVIVCEARLDIAMMQDLSVILQHALPQEGTIVMDAAESRMSQPYVCNAGSGRE